MPRREKDPVRLLLYRSTQLQFKARRKRRA